MAPRAQAPSPRRHTWLFPASGTRVYGVAGGGLQLALLAPMFAALLVAGLVAVAGYLTGHLMVALGLAVLVIWLPLLFNAPRAKRLRAGLHGERLAENQLRRVPDAVIFNDVMLGKENADQVVVTREGIFTVEVKHWADVVADRRGVTSRHGKHHPEQSNRVLAQAARQSAKLSRRLRLPVRPVVVFTHPNARVHVQELDGVTLCRLVALPATITRLRREAHKPLSRSTFDRVVNALLPPD